MNVFLRTSAIVIESQKEERLYSLSIPDGAPYSEIESTIGEFMAHITLMKEAAAKRAELEKEKTDTPKEPDVIR